MKKLNQETVIYKDAQSLSLDEVLSPRFKEEPKEKTYTFTEIPIPISLVLANVCGGFEPGAQAVKANISITVTEVVENNNLEEISSYLRRAFPDKYEGSCETISESLTNLLIENIPFCSHCRVFIHNPWGGMSTEWNSKMSSKPKFTIKKSSDPAITWGYKSCSGENHYETK